MTSKLITGRTLGAVRFAAQINVFALALNALWNPINVLLLPILVRGLVPETFKGSALGLITFVGIGIAAIVQPVAGRINDKVALPHRRRGFIAGGSAFALVGLALLAWSPNFWWLLGAYVLLQIATNVAQAAFQAIIPAFVADRDRGLASGVMNGLTVIGIAVGLGGAGFLTRLGAGTNIVLLFVAVILGVCAALSVWWVPDSTTPDETEIDLGRMLHGFVRIFREQRTYRLTVVTRFLFLLGLYPLQRLFVYYLDSRFNITNLSQVTVFLLLAVGAAVAAAALAGVVSDRLGRAKVMEVAVVVGTTGVLGVAVAPVPLVAAGFGALVAMSLGAFQAVNWAKLSDETPDGREAEFLGLSNLATAGASACASLFGPLADAANAILPSTGYNVTFALAALLAGSALIPARRLAPATGSSRAAHGRRAREG